VTDDNAAVEVIRRDEATGDSVSVADVTYTSAGIRPTDAYLVRPAEGPIVAGILYYHWLELRADDSNRTEFLAEAKRMAKRGVCALLIQGDLPWLRDPSGPRTDRELIVQEMRGLSAGLDLLSQSGVGTGPIAVVGHDFGAMFGVLLVLEDRRPSAYLLMAATSRWGDWFVPYWDIAESRDEYDAAMAGIQPIDAVARAAPAALLFQFARRDHLFVPIPLAEQFFDTASEPKELRWYSCGHRMNHLAEREREAWLAERLGLAGGG
jgi:hypothetical protein